MDGKLQDIVKTLFSHPTLSVSHNLGAINSINWARILAQIVYYFSSYFALPSGTAPSFVVPTGNFGDILAGYFAHRMGLPTANLTIATNENDILHRFLETGRYEKTAPGATEGVKATYSPAMDILISSNFERLLWILAHETLVDQSLPLAQRHEEASRLLAEWMAKLKTENGVTIPEPLVTEARKTFTSRRVSDSEILETIKEIFLASASPAQAPYILDPHTAVGVKASLLNVDQGLIPAGTPVISLSTAHPAKFDFAVEKALKGLEAYKGFDEMVRPVEFIGLEDKEKRVRFSKADPEEVREIVLDELVKEGVDV